MCLCSHCLQICIVVWDTWHHYLQWIQVLNTVQKYLCVREITWHFNSWHQVFHTKRFSLAANLRYGMHTFYADLSLANKFSEHEQWAELYNDEELRLASEETMSPVCNELGSSVILKGIFPCGLCCGMLISQGNTGRDLLLVFPKIQLGYRNHTQNPKIVGLNVMLKHKEVSVISFGKYDWCRTD